MATRKKGTGRDDFDSDLDFDIPSFDGMDDPEISQDNRKPLTTAVNSTAAGFGKSFANPARLRKTLTKALPREYEEPISKAFEIKNGATDLYNNLGQEVRKTVVEGKRGLGRIVRNLGDSLPKGMREKLEKVLHVDEGSSSYQSSKEEMENSAVQQAMNEVFAEDIKTRADERKQDEAKDAIQKTIDKRRHKDMTSLLGSIDQSLIGMYTYQDRITTNYMKKKLDLAIRGHFLQTEMLALQAKSFHEITESLGAITKNTGLPDYVKKATKEHLVEHMRTRAFDSLTNTLYDRRRQYIDGVVKRGNTMIKDKFSQFRDGMGQLMDVGDMMSSMAGSEFGPSIPEMAGEAAGSWAGGKLQDKAANAIRKRLANNPKAVQRGNSLSRIFSQIPQYVQHQLTRGKFADKVPDFVRELARDEGSRTSIDTDRELDMERATQFSEKNSRTLNVVIPELLSMIHNELQITRTGDASQKPVRYDYESGKFVSAGARRVNALRNIVSDSDRATTKASADDIFKDLDPTGKKLNAKERRAISEELYRQNKGNRYFDKAYFEDIDFMSGVQGGEKFKKLLNSHLSEDYLGSKETALAKSMSRLGQYNGDVTDVITAMYKAGRGGELAEMGLLDMSTGQINQEMLRRLELGDVSLEELANGGHAPKTPRNRRRSSASKSLSGTQSFGKLGFGSMNLQGLGIAGLTGNIDTNRLNDEATAKLKSRSAEENIDWSAMSSSFKEATDALSRLSRGGKADSGCCEEITKAITESNNKTQLEEIRDILIEIEKKEFGGLYMDESVLDRFNEMMGGMRDRMKSRGDKALGFGKKWLGKGWDAIKRNNTRSLNFSKNVVTTAWDWGKKGLDMAGDFMSKKVDEFDLFIGRGKKPRLTAAKIKAGQYKDVLTGKIIEKFEDITGDVLDLETDEIVLRAEELKNAVLRNFKTGKTQFARATTWGRKMIEKAKQSLKESGTRALSMLGGVYGVGFDLARKGWNILTDAPQDIYVKGDLENPVMFKYIMEAGRYFDRKTGATISKPSQIKGPVIDEDGNIVVSNKAIKKGLVDKKGRPLTTGLGKLLQMGKDTFSNMLNFGKNAWNKAKDMFSGVWEWIGGAKSPLTITTRKTNEILIDIFELLFERLPGKKVAGDLDGDGVRNGSYEDIVRKRREAKQKKDDAKNGTGPNGKKGATGLAAAMEMIRQGMKKPGEEEEGGDGDTYIMGGGDGDGKKDKDGKGKDAKGKPKAPAKPRGRLGRGWDKLKGFLTPKEGGLMSKGLTMGGKALGGLWSVAKNAVGLTALSGIASATGVVASAGMVGTAATSILGILGSALTIGASAVGAILSSPVVLTAAAVGMIGYGAYKGFQALTEVTPGPLGKIRLAQYGWPANKTEKFGDMLKVEALAMKAVTFSGNEAKLDASKLDIKQMMDIFGLDPKNEEHAKKFLNWFANRFRVFFLNHLGVLKQMDLKMDLVDIDDKMEDKKKLDYLKQILFPGDAYTIPTSPYKKETFLVASQGTVERLIDEATNTLQKKVDRSSMTAEQRKAEITAQLNKSMGIETDLAKAAAAEQKKDSGSVAGVPPKLGPEKAAEAAMAASHQNSANARMAAAIGGGNFDKDPITGSAVGPDGRAIAPTAPGSYQGGMSVSHPGNGTGGSINDLVAPLGNKSWTALKDTILGAAKMAGVSPKTAVAIAAIESGFDYTARPWNKNKQKFESSAKGIYQFLDGTWDGMMKNHASKYGIDPNTTAMDPRANALMGMEFLKDNTNYLRKKLGREPNATDIYMAHFMGPGGAVQFLNKNPNTIGAAAFPDAAASNSWVYYHDPQTKQRPKTLGEIYQGFTVKLANKLKEYGVMDSELDGPLGPANAADPKATANGVVPPAPSEQKNPDTPTVGDPSVEQAMQAQAAAASSAKAGAPPIADIPASMPAGRPAPPGYNPGSGAPPSAPNPNLTLPERMNAQPSAPAASSAPTVAPQTTQSTAAQQYGRENAAINQGEVPSLLKEGIGYQKTMVDHLSTMVGQLADVVTLLTDVAGNTAGQSSGPTTPIKSNTTVDPSKIPVEQPKMNQSYRRTLTGRTA